MTSEDIVNLFVSLICMAVGIFIVVLGINLHFLVPRIPKSKNWAKTRGKVVGRRDYVQKAPPSKYDYRSGVKLIRGREKIIVYTVNGETYKKAVPEECRGAAHIYYKKSTPHYFKTVYELKNHKRKIGGARVFIAELFLAAILLCLGVFGIVDFFGK